MCAILWTRYTNRKIVQKTVRYDPNRIFVDNVLSVEVNKRMKIKAYLLYDHAVALQPAPPVRDWRKGNTIITANLALPNGSSQAWDLLCPLAFTATWNGGARPEDIEIRLEGGNAGQPAFVQSNLGDGLLTFYPGYQFKTEAAYPLWVRGPRNTPKDGLYPLECLVDASSLPYTVIMHWKFTRPHQTIRFATTEPFATILPYPRSDLANVNVEMIQPEGDADAYDQVFQQLVASPAVHNLFQRLGSTETAVTPAAAAVAVDVTPLPKSWAAQLTNPPPVSCICPTSGRVALLEEAIYSFLQQDYPGPKELIVLNDYDQQTLEFDHPEVRIINLPRRFASVGEKYKAAAALATHDLVFVWHDDDIYLPHRLSYSVAQCDQNTAFFKAEQAWFWNDGKLSGPERNTFHGGSCWRRDLFCKVQGYPHIGNRYDIEFEALCIGEALGGVRIDPIQAADIYYIYRWRATGSYHLSAMGADGQEHQKVAAYVAQQAARGQIPQGDVQLKPQWQSDYCALVQTYLATRPAAQKAPHTVTAHPTEPLPLGCFDTINGRLDLQQFEPNFFLPERFFGRSKEQHLRHDGEIYGRDFYFVDAMKLVYLSIPKVACTAIKLALAKAAGFAFEPGQDIELAVHHHPQWCWAQGKLAEAQSGYERFTFVRNPFDRLVSCYRQKIITESASAHQAPLFRDYFFAIPANISFTDFAQRISKIPDALADSHFKSQYALLYRGEELQVDYIGKFEQFDQDWQPLAEKYQLEPLLAQVNISKNKAGCHSDYRLYYTEPLVQLIYERYRKDIHAFGYEEEYAQLLAFVRTQQQNVLSAIRA